MSAAAKPSKPANLQILPLTALFFATAFILYLSGMVFGIFKIPHLAMLGQVREEAGWTFTHFFLLGWVSMLAMGASFQLVQVILNAKLFSRVLGFIHYCLYTCGMFILLISLQNGSWGVAIGGCLIAAGVLIYLWNMICTIIRAHKWNVFVLGMLISLLHLLITVVLGTFMGISWELGWKSSLYNHLFMSHLWFGVGGWVSGLIITYSFKLLPMFHVSRKKPGADCYWIISLFQGGVWLMVGSIWLQSKFIGTIALGLVSVSALLLVRFVYIVRARGKRPGGAVTIVVYLIPLTLIFFGYWAFNDIIWPNTLFHQKLTVAFLFFLVVGWFSATIFSYLSKIVPFLWWAHQFHSKWGKKNMIQLADMTNDFRLQCELVLYLLAVVVVSVAFFVHNLVLARFGQVGAAAAGIIYIVELVRILRY